MKRDQYQLLASGRGLKIEQFGPYVIQRPASQAVWNKSGNLKLRLNASFTRENGNSWEFSQLPNEWSIEVSDIRFKLSATDFGHLGIFPEQRPFWRWITEVVKSVNREIHVLNLFAYSGGSTLAAAKGGAFVCHVDASKGMIDWAKENAELNQLDQAPIRWIIDDVYKFIKREVRRGKKYDAIILDPPTFGRGAKGEVFKIEEQLIPILQACRELLSDNPLFVLLSCHTPGYTATTLTNLLNQLMPAGKVEAGEMFLDGLENAFPIPSGCYGRWLPC